MANPYSIPWYLIDKDGWPIELQAGRPVSNFFRVVVQNIRKITK